MGLQRLSNSYSARFSWDIPVCQRQRSTVLFQRALGPRRDLLGTMALRYSFPTWATNRSIISSFSSHSTVRHFGMRITRRIPYVPSNIFSRINSKDFSGAIALLQSGNAHVNDIETRHGISVLGAALRRPTLSTGFIRFIEFLLQRQANPHIPNDEGESAWHFAARLMLPNTPTTIASTELQSQLHPSVPSTRTGISSNLPTFTRRLRDFDH
jgi:hypothetical protein